MEKKYFTIPINRNFKQIKIKDEIDNSHNWKKFINFIENYRSAKFYKKYEKFFLIFK